jgi:hypothetical protein
LPTSEIYSGRTVSEQDGGGGVDNCKNNFPESPIANQGRVPESSTTVDASNQYFDRVGWTPFAVQTYRNAGAAPCDFQTNQRMFINLGQQGVIFEYKANALAAGITLTTVWSRRDGVEEERVWP